MTKIVPALRGEQIHINNEFIFLPSVINIKNFATFLHRVLTWNEYFYLHTFVIPWFLWMEIFLFVCLIIAYRSINLSQIDCVYIHIYTYIYVRKEKQSHYLSWWKWKSYRTYLSLYKESCNCLTQSIRVLVSMYGGQLKPVSLTSI